MISEMNYSQANLEYRVFLFGASAPTTHRDGQRQVHPDSLRLLLRPQAQHLAVHVALQGNVGRRKRRQKRVELYRTAAVITHLSF